VTSAEADLVGRAPNPERTIGPEADVYGTCMAKVRTNIVIEDDYVRAIMRRYGLRTKTEVVDLALRRLATEPMTREEALAMRGSNSIGELPADQPPHGAVA
jgi:Arc/MetJ family transcription regulator